MRRLLLLTVTLAGCGDNHGDGGRGPSVRIDPVDEWVHGEVTLPVGITGEVDQVDLYIDGEIVETFAAVPERFTLATSDLADGVREIWVAAQGPDGVGADALWLSVDNHAPTLDYLGMSDGFTLEFAIGEEGSGVDLAEVTWPDGAVAISAAPWRAVLPECVTADVDVRVVDAAGWEATLTMPVVTGLTGDVFADGFDRDCDGVDGIDLDGDGVPGTSFGDAPDCDDGDPLAHGQWGDWSPPERFATSAGIYAPYRIAVEGERLAVAYLDYDGMLRVVRGTTGGVWTPSVALDYAYLWWQDAPPMVLDATGAAHLLFTESGSDTLRYVKVSGDAIVDETLGTGYALGIARTADGVVHAIYVSGATVRHAWRLGADSWQSEQIPGASMVQGVPGVFVDGDQLVAVLHSSFGTEVETARLVDGNWQLTLGPWVEMLAHAARGDPTLDGGAVVYATRTDIDGLEIWGGRFGPFPGTTLPTSDNFQSSLAIGVDGRVHVVIADRNQSFISVHWVHDGASWQREPVAVMPGVTTDAAGRVHGAFFGVVPGTADWPSTLFHVAEGTPVGPAGCPSLDPATARRR